MAGWIDGRVPNVDAVWVDVGKATASKPSFLHLRHPGYGWAADVGERVEDAEAAALEYLRAVAAFAPEHLEKPTRLLANRNACFGWLPVLWNAKGESAESDPNTSFELGAPGGGMTQVVLLAAHRMGTPPTLAIGDGVGLRVTATRVLRAGSGKAGSSEGWTLTFTSVNATRIEELREKLPAWIKKLVEDRQARKLRKRLQDVLAAEHPSVHALHPSTGSENWIARGTAVRHCGKPANGAPDQPRSRVCAFEVEVDPQLSIVSVAKFRDGGMSALLDPTKSGAAVRPRTAAPLMQSKPGVPASAVEPLVVLGLFERDPASQVEADQLALSRPSRVASDLDARRDFVSKVPSFALETRVPLDEPNGRFFVSHERTSPAFDYTVQMANRSIATLPELAMTAADPATALPLRTDDLSAAQAYVRAREFFDRLHAYGLEPATYFRHARLPLELRARARLAGAHNGNVLNAEVRPFFRDDGNARQARDQRAQLVVRFGSADSNVRFDKPGATVREQQQTLGLAADPRWAWHEFGHVLNYAATGELEFAFAHSAGDALAAIAADPDSNLANDQDARGLTFPWAYAPRRHDRRAVLGYCWCGRRLASMASVGAPRSDYRQGYFAEQLMSSSLFRLYLAIGGATGTLASDTGAADDLTVRRSASDYCVYLIMRAIGLLGSNAVCPAVGAEQFVGALIDADLGTDAWRILAPWPYRESPREVTRLGGRVHKVVRWAFEQQGLYADPDAQEGPGQPPKVDIFVADCRPGEAGGYEPVPLRWHADGAGAWCATAGAIRVDGDTIDVQVQQRGTQEGALASAVVTAWWRAPGSGWTRCSERAGRPVLPADCPRKDTWVLVAVDHPADPSNLRPNEAPPHDHESLIELVANDNNLALMRLP